MFHGARSSRVLERREKGVSWEERLEILREGGFELHPSSRTSKTWARKFFERWVEQLTWSRLEPYQKFARMVETHLDGILAYCDKHVPLGYIEGIIKAKNIIRRAYGYRDKESMKLKIIQGCSSLGVFRPWAFTHTHSS